MVTLLTAFELAGMSQFFCEKAEQKEVQTTAGVSILPISISIYRLWNEIEV